MSIADDKQVWMYDPAIVTRVLVADDSFSLRLALRTALEAGGFAEVIEAPDGSHALALAITRRPNVAILDVSMGADNGFDVCRAIRADERLAGLAVIMLTGHTEPPGEAERLAREAGADCVLFKPVSPRILRVSVEELVAGPR